jgi:uncharacterized protein YggU (UPF0235/DUF167 family)
VRLSVRLSPRARADRIDGLARLTDGTAVLKVSVTAPPADDRANDALLRLLAKEWGIARRELVHVTGDPAALLQGPLAALAALPQP